MRWDDFRSSDNVEDRRGDGGGGGFRMPGGRGGLGIGTIIIVGIVGWALGINPAVLIGGLEAINGMSGGSAPQQQQAAPRTAPQGAPKDELGRFAAAVLAQTCLLYTSDAADE